MPTTAMPEATIHKYRNLALSENKIGATFYIVRIAYKSSDTRTGQRAR